MKNDTSGIVRGITIVGSSCCCWCLCLLYAFGVFDVKASQNQTNLPKELDPTVLVACLVEKQEIEKCQNMLYECVLTAKMLQAMNQECINVCSEMCNSQ